MLDWSDGGTEFIETLIVDESVVLKLRTHGDLAPLLQASSLAAPDAVVVALTLLCDGRAELLGIAQLSDRQRQFLDLVGDQRQEQTSGLGIGGAATHDGALDRVHELLRG